MGDDFLKEFVAQLNPARPECLLIGVVVVPPKDRFRREPPASGRFHVPVFVNKVDVRVKQPVDLILQTRSIPPTPAAVARDTEALHESGE